MNSLTIAWNMIRRTIGTKKGLFLHIALPSIVITLAIALFGQDGNSNVKVLYVNKDHGTAGEYLLGELMANADYVLEEMSTAEELREAIINKRGEVGFVIPSGFTEEIWLGNVMRPEVYHLTISEGSYMVSMRLDTLTQRLVSFADMDGGAHTAGDDAMLSEVIALASQQVISADVTDLQLYAKPGLNVVTGFTLMFLMGLISTSVTQIVNDRRRGTMTRMFSAPVRAWEITMGNFLGSLAMGLLQIVIILLLSRFIAGYNYGTPIVWHFVVLGAFMLVAMGISSAVASVVRNTQQIGLINGLIITPTCMIGGCFWPISFMPDFMQKAANAVPQKWAIEAVELLSEGGGASQITLPLVILGLMAFVLLAFGSVALRPGDAHAN